MTFEEQFPSLKNTGINLGLSDVEEVTRDLVIKHCLDKQRVIEALEKCRKKLGPDYVGIRTFHTLMIEELGL